MKAILAAVLVFAVWAAPAIPQTSGDVQLIEGTPQWLERPDPPPFRPARTDLPGSALVVLDCLVSADGRLLCRVLTEEPAGWGFGDAALRLSRGYRMAPTTVEGQPTANRRYLMRVPFVTA